MYYANMAIFSHILEHCYMKIIILMLIYMYYMVVYDLLFILNLNNLFKKCFKIRNGYSEPVN